MASARGKNCLRHILRTCLMYASGARMPACSARSSAYSASSIATSSDAAESACRLRLSAGWIARSSSASASAAVRRAVLPSFAASHASISAVLAVMVPTFRSSAVRSASSALKPACSCACRESSSCPISLSCAASASTPELCDCRLACRQRQGSEKPPGEVNGRQRSHVADRRLPASSLGVAPRPPPHTPLLHSTFRILQLDQTAQSAFVDSAECDALLGCPQLKKGEQVVAWGGGAAP
mmetsp:Transcript_30577/g.77141  ORF Transcript_30577/g.77141 Transcript_30577/m.77141 type:complete len:239 (+) Transcript_30577:389-1105(+)